MCTILHVCYNSIKHLTNKSSVTENQMIGMEADHLNLNCCQMNTRGPQVEPFRVWAKGKGLCAHVLGFASVTEDEAFS